MANTPEHWRSIDSNKEHSEVTEVSAENLEQLIERFILESEAVIAELRAQAEPRLEAIQRLGGDPAEAQAILEHSLIAARNLQAELRESLQPETNGALSAPTEHTQQAVELQQLVDKSKQLKPAIDGVKPPEEPVAVGDNDELAVEQADQQVTVTKTEVATEFDPYAERNQASVALLTRLTEPDLSIPGQSDLGLLKAARELILRHHNEQLAVRLDDLGNMIIGRPERGGNGLSTRLLTIRQDRDAGTLAWLQRSMPDEMNLLKRYTVYVLEDPNLDHEKQVDIDQVAA